MEISAHDNRRGGSPAFVMSYFTLADEALHLAVSDDGVHFEPLLGGTPLLRSEQGAHSIRDPFIGEGVDGRFHLLGTDGWRSNSVVHSVSDDLLQWSTPELIPVMAEIAGTYNAWAPEFFTDPATGIHHLLWSSIVDPASTPPTGAWVDPVMRQRIWTSRTTDFVDFTPAEVFFDPGYTVIDATVAVDSDGFLMAFKDERGRNDLATDNKTIRFARFPHPGAPFHLLDSAVPFSPVEGPSLFRRDGEWVVIFDRFLEDAYAAATSRD
ncbi:hypothetical protein FJ656_33200, partial [Schumannella luteola]